MVKSHCCHCPSKVLTRIVLVKTFSMAPRLLWDRKRSFREKKHERYGSPARQKNSSSHRGFMVSKQQGSIKFQQPVGPGTLGGGARHRVPEEPSHGSGSGSGSCDMTLREDKGRSSSISRPICGAIRAPRDPRRKFWEATHNASLSLPSKRPTDDVPTHPSPENTWKHRHSKERWDDNSKQSHERESSVGWKPLKWNRLGRFSSRDPGKARLLDKDGTEETRKKPRLNWGEGLAEFEKKKIEEADVSANKDGTGLPPSNMEATATTPTSVACSSLTGVGDTLCVKAAYVDNDVGNLGGSPAPGSQNHQRGILERIDVDTLTSLGSSLVELLESDDPSSVDSSVARSTAMNKVLIWKAVISKVLEVTQTEIDSLENELKSLQSESGVRLPCSPAAGSLLVCHSAKSCEEDIGGSDKVTCPETLQIAPFDEGNVEKMRLSTNLHGMHDNSKEDDISSPGIATSKFVESLPLIRAVSSCDATRYGTCSKNLDGIQSTAKKCLVSYTYGQVASVSSCGDGNSYLSMEIKYGMDANSSASFYSCTDDTLYNTIISSNKESAKRACEVFANLLPKECGKISNVGVSSSSLSLNDAFIKKKFAEKKWFARFKEKVLTTKYEALNHLWKKDLCLRSVRKCPPTSHKNLELGLQTISKGCQKNRSSIHYRFPFPARNQLSLVPTSEMIDYTSQLLSESQDKVNRSILKMPTLILDQKDKMISKFKSSNGRVEDPLAIEKERAMINPWTSEERNIFLEKFAAFGKDFRNIASFIDHKTNADCVEFYYKNHKSDCFEKIKKKKSGEHQKLYTAKTGLMASGKKKNGKVNVDSREILSDDPVMAHGIPGNQRTRSGRLVLWRGYDNMKISTGDGITERSNSLDILQDERKSVAADVLAGKCGSPSFKAMSSFITRSVDPVEANRDRTCLKVRPLCQQPVMPDVTQDIDGRTSDKSCGEMDPSDWTDEEKAAFLQAVSSFGKDFTRIAQHVGTRSQDQCKIFFIKGQKGLRLDLMHHRPEYIGSLGNDVNGGRSDTDDACVVAADSVSDSDKSGTKTDEDQPSSVMNSNHDESKPVKARNLSADLNESKQINEEVDLVDVNMVSNACAINGESKLGTDGCGVVLYSSDKSSSVRNQRAIIMSDIMEVGKDKVGDVVTELVSASKIIEPCHSQSVAEDRLVSEELGELPKSLNDRDDKHEADIDVVVELKNQSHDSNTTANTSLSSGGISCSRSTFGAENQPQLFLKKSNYSGSSMEDPFTTANKMLQNTACAAVQQEKTATQDGLSCDFRGNRHMSALNSISIGGHQLHNPGNSLDHVEATRIQCYPLKEPIKKQESTYTSCSSSATELPILSQKIEQTDDHYKTQLLCSSGSEKTPRNVVFKLFGKILTIPSSAQKPDLTTKGNEENGTHHPKFTGC
ncbi:Nuclear receptor corepressor 1 [Spatholobus suberectus]|nr:Nuclear receptor corepressor 1 [Spatholobus suberectus]